MKALMITFLMVVIMALFWVGFTLYTENTTDVLVSSMNAVYAQTMSGQPQAAGISCRKFLSDWDQYSKVYGLYYDNVCVHDIELSARRCLGYIEAGDSSLILGESASIISHLELLKEADRIRAFNIF